MYLPKTLEITSPYITRWYGESGRQYEFGVVRPSSLRVDEPFVYILAKHEGNMFVPLSVGQTLGGRTASNASLPQEWEQALAEGMTHAHLRFNARSEGSRQAEVRDLVVALRPMLNALPMSESDFIRLNPHRPVEEAALEVEIGSRPAAHQGEPAPKRFTAARSWNSRAWVRAWAAMPSLGALLGRLWRPLPATRGSGLLPAEALETGEHAERNHDGVTEDDTADTAARTRHDDQNKQPVAESPVPKPPVSQPPVPQAPEPEPLVSEPLVSEPLAGARSDGVAGKAKAVLDLDPRVPLALFADELSAPAGADILVDAVITIRHDDRPLNFLFVGEGPLRGELEARVRAADLGQRARFLGDASAETFEQVFAAADFVVIPARTHRGGALACRAAAAGKPVLVTHQACVDVVLHGSNGLVTYDNPGSLVWGLRELVHCPWFATSTETRSQQKAAVQSVAA